MRRLKTIIPIIALLLIATQICVAFALQRTSRDNDTVDITGTILPTVAEFTVPQSIIIKLDDITKPSPKYKPLELIILNGCNAPMQFGIMGQRGMQAREAELITKLRGRIFNTDLDNSNIISFYFTPLKGSGWAKGTRNELSSLKIHNTSNAVIDVGNLNPNKYAILKLDYNNKGIKDCMLSIQYKLEYMFNLMD